MDLLRFLAAVWLLLALYLLGWTIGHSAGWKAANKVRDEHEARTRVPRFRRFS